MFVNMEKMGKSYQVNDEYTIELHTANDNLLICAPTLCEHAAFKFEDSAIPKHLGLLEFKHHHPKKGKWWSEKPGAFLFFAIPKKNILVDTEKSGYSYVFVQINGQEFCLNCSGGTNFAEKVGWTDYVSDGVCTVIVSAKKHMKLLKNASTEDDRIVELLQKDNMFRSPEEEERFHAAYAYYQNKTNMKPGDKIFLTEYYSFDGKHGPFKIIDVPKRKQYFVCEEDGMTFKAEYKKIDWMKIEKEE